MSILQMSLSIPITSQSLSSSKSLSISAQSLCLTTKLSHLSLTIPTSKPYRTTPIRMGGGPRTFPGGVSKWQWKRMQAKKSKQLLKARLARERQIYEMRKRAELKAAVSELERPWETVEKPPNLFSVGADEQVKVLADRFQKPGGLDLWSERDGPELFRPDTGFPSARFFPKGVVHSIKPYRKMEELDAASDVFESSGLGEDSKPREMRKLEAPVSDNGRNVSERSLKGVAKEGNFKGSPRKKGNTRMYSSDSDGKNSGDARFHNRDDRRSGRHDGAYKEVWRSKDQNMNSEVFDMSLVKDGSYGIELEK